MKVGTDGVLLGAWTPLPPYGEGSAPFEVLEIGCGCGIVSLMLAQRLQEGGWQGNFGITAIDIHEPSCREAARNAAQSPWGGSLAVENTDFLRMPEKESFSLLVSNPPFFDESLKSPDAARNLARHNDTLPFAALLEKSQRLLHTGGVLSLVLPPRAFEKMQLLQKESAPRLALVRLTRVFSKPEKACERLLCAWQKTSGIPDSSTVREESLFIQDAQGGYGEAYRRLVKDFYLWA
ncbi:MAG: methyltransferase [Bacteroidales bacterium]|nr:methyltransferase [Bacteroidales bacterium]